MQFSYMLSSTSITNYKLVEFYCGIGGMRSALKAAGIAFEVVAAIDVNPVSNMIYQHNFGNGGLMQRNIESFTIGEIENMEADIMTMSPPCQPFTRVGLKKDTEDSRSTSFIYLLNILLELKKKPQYFILENVKGFETSDSRNSLVQTLRNCGYRYQEFLLTASDFGIPNSRLRYYLIAKCESLNFIFPLLEQVHTTFPVASASYLWKSVCAQCHQSPELSPDICPLDHFLEHRPFDYFSTFLMPDNILLKYWTVLDIVSEKSYCSCCFTKAYGRYALGTGSVLNCWNGSKATETFKKVTETSDESELLNLLKSLQLRYFTPKEIANIMCFPEQFGFPEPMTSKQLYRCLGNSINVFVVACLANLLFKNA